MSDATLTPPATGAPRRTPPARRAAGLRLVGRRRATEPLPWRVAVAGTALFVVLVGVVALQAVLIGGQRRLDQLQRDIDDARVTQNALRREESMLRTPSDIRDLATERLGMVPADLPALVDPPPRVIGGPTTSPGPGR